MNNPLKYSRIDIRTVAGIKKAERLQALGYKVIQSGLTYVLMERKIKKVNRNPIDPQGVAAWLEAAYHDERKGIIEYEKLYKRIEGIPEYAPLRKTLKRIIKDEKRHMNTLSRILGF